MGIFSKAIGLDDSGVAYKKTMDYCLKSIKKRANERNINLDALIANSGHSKYECFVEVSILFFIASAAISDENPERNMMLVRGYAYSTLANAAKEFLRENGMRGLDLEFYQIERLKNTGGQDAVNALNMLTQGAFGTEFILNDKAGSINSAARIMDDFLDTIERGYPRT